MSQTKQTFTESGTFLINTGGQGVGPDGLALLFTETGTQSLVLKVNTAPPGAAASYTNIPYRNGSLAVIGAGNAITSSGIYYVSAENAALDLYMTLTATSGSTVVEVSPANYGAETFTGPVTITSGGLAVTGASTFADTVAVGNTVDIQAGGLSVVDRITEGGDPGEATTINSFAKAITGIANNTATPLATVTVPNGAESAVIRLTVCGSLGAGGAIGANEASASNSYNLTIARTAGVAAVGTMSTAYGAAAAAVAGAATCTSTLALSTVSGAVGATNTFTINGTIARSAGSSTNHTALLLVEVLNANATGVTVA